MLDEVAKAVLRKRRVRSLMFAVVVFGVFQLISRISSSNSIPSNPQPNDVLAEQVEQIDPSLYEDAGEMLEALPVKGRAPKTGYSRDNFSGGWARVGSCDVRNLVLRRDMASVRLDADLCRVLSGTLNDPYTGRTISFQRGPDTSDEVQIDHVVALSDAWQKGAQQLTDQERFNLYNDSLNLLAVDGQANQDKGSSDAASWLPPNKQFRCRLVARQISVKAKYRLWVTEAEKSAMARVLNDCPAQPLPVQLFNVEDARPTGQ